MKPIQNEEKDVIYTTGINAHIQTIRPASNIVITSPNGGTLTLDFNGPRLEAIATGGMEISEAAWLFFQYVHDYVARNR